MDKEFIKELIELVNSSSLTKFELKTDQIELKIEKEPPKVVTPAEGGQPVQTAEPVTPKEFKSEKILPPSEDVETPEEKLHVIKSPLVGTFYRAPAPGAPPLCGGGGYSFPRTGALHYRGSKSDERNRERRKGEGGQNFGRKRSAGGIRSTPLSDRYKCVRVSFG